MLQPTPTRLQPPSDLSPAAQREFRRLIDSTPSDWFHEGCLQMVVQLCRHTVLSHWLAEKIEVETDSERITTLLEMQAAESKMISILMTKLRLTPRAMNSRVGRTAAPKPAFLDVPWSKLREK